MDVLLLEKRKCPGLTPLVFLVSDGRANMSMGGNIRTELQAVSERIRERGIRMVVIDTEYGASPALRVRLGYCRMIADVSMGHYYRLDELNADTLHTIAVKEQHAMDDALC
jgi:magnesium chelatase subunit D